MTKMCTYMVFVPCHGCFANGTPATYPLYIPFHMRQSVPSKHSRKQFSQRAIMDTQMIFKQKITIKPIEFSTSKLLTFIVSIFKVRVMLRTCLEFFQPPINLESCVESKTYLLKSALATIFSLPCL